MRFPAQEEEARQRKAIINGSGGGEVLSVEQPVNGTANQPMILPPIVTAARTLLFHSSRLCSTLPSYSIWGVWRAWVFHFNHLIQYFLCGFCS